MSTRAQIALMAALGILTGFVVGAAWIARGYIG